MTKNCLNPKCQKEFTPKNNKGVYCSANCRAAHAYQLKSGKETVRMELPKDLVGKIGYFKADGTMGIIESPEQLSPETLGAWKEYFKVNHPTVDIQAVNNIDFGGDKSTSAEQIENVQIQKQIDFIQNEIKNPPKNPGIGMKAWIAVRQNKISELQKQLK